MYTIYLVYPHKSKGFLQIQLMMVLLQLQAILFSFLLGIISILCDVLDSPASFSWHANSPLTARSHEPQCTDFHEQNDRLDLEELTGKYLLWPGKRSFRNTHVSDSVKNSLKVNSTIYGLEYALDTIWKHQHPENCSAARFLIAAPHEGGFGSVVHVYGAVLGVAMDLDRVYLPHPYDANAWQFNTPHCMKEIIDPFTNETVKIKVDNLECYYEPWSSCTIYDALGPKAMTLIDHIHRFELSHRVVGYLEDKDFVKIVRNGTDPESTMLGIHNERYIHGVVPNSLSKMLACSPIPKHHWYYWWRAISSTYLMRPNLKTREWMEQHALPDLNEDQDIFSAIYVRRGDKDIEMHMVPVDAYLNATEILWRDYIQSPGDGIQHQHHHHNAISHKLTKNHRRKVFLATEDSQVLEEIIAWGNASYRNFSLSTNTNNNVQVSPIRRRLLDTMSAVDHYYDIHYTNLFNRSGLWAEKHILFKHNKKHIPQHHPDEYLSMMLNIHYLIHAYGWVCTLASNFCRLIDELRATIGARADLAFIDLSRESCPSQFCAYQGINNFGW